MRADVITGLVLPVLLLRADAEDNRVSPGVIGFLVVAALGVATWLLIRSMGRQMRKIDLPDDDPVQPRADHPQAADQSPADQPVATAEEPAESRPDDEPR